MDVRFWMATTTRCTTRHWNDVVEHEPWSKLYVVSEGRAAYAVARPGGPWRETALVLGRLYLIPGSRRHRNSCRADFTLQWCHFTLDAELEPRVAALDAVASWPLAECADDADLTALTSATGAGRLRAAALVLRALSLLPDPGTDPLAAERARLAPAIAHLEYRFAGPQTVDDLARRCGLRPSRFQELFRRVVGASPGAHLIALRLGEARRLLANTDLGVAEIGALVGWDNPYHFSRIFRAHLGSSPRAWRAAHLTPGIPHPAR